MCSYSSVADLARRMRIEPNALLARFREAGVFKADAESPVFDGDVAALSALYRNLLGQRAIEIATELGPESPREEETRINPVLLLGNLGDCPETRYMPSGDAVTNIRLATTDRYRQLCERVLFYGNVPQNSRVLFFLDLLQGHVPAGMRLLSRRILRAGLLASVEALSRAHRRSAQITRGTTSLARQVQSCKKADLESTIHPAFAPPAVVI